MSQSAILSPHRTMLRYLVVTSGPFGSAGVQFLLSLILLRTLEPAQFGAFSLLFIVSQFLILIWSALFCAPAVLQLAPGYDRTGLAMVDAICAASIVAATACGIAMLTGGLWLGLSLTSATGFALYTAFSLLRWLGRSVCYSRDAVSRVALSDHGYSLVLVAATLWIALAPSTAALEIACLGLAGAMFFALAALGGEYARMQLRALHLAAMPSGLRRYRHVWHKQGSMSLTGVLAAEFLANNQALMVTAIQGPGAYAPLAACFLLVRPIPIAIAAMSEYERARMASALRRKALGEMRSLLHSFLGAMVAIWSATGLLAAILLGAAPELIFPSSLYAPPVLVSGTILWVAIALPRCLRAPAATLLQAAGEFRPIALAGAVGSAVSIGAVTFLLLHTGAPVLTLVGTFAGETLATLMIWRAVVLWNRRLAARLTEPAGILAGPQ